MQTIAVTYAKLDQVFIGLVSLRYTENVPHRYLLKAVIPVTCELVDEHDQWGIQGKYFIDP